MSSADIRINTRVWAALVGLTLATFAAAESGLAGPAVMLGVLAVTFVKGQLVARHFMGLARVRLLWRAVVGAWLFIVGALIALAYLIALP